MTTQWKIDLKGLNEYFDSIKEMLKDSEEAAARAIMAGAEVAQEGMKRRVPVKSGNLKAHIKIKGVNFDGKSFWADVGVIHDIAFTDPKTARYANVQEYGSAHHNKPHPYIRPTMIEDREKVMEAMKQSLEKDLDI